MAELVSARKSSGRHLLIRAATCVLAGALLQCPLAESSTAAPAVASRSQGRWELSELDNGVAIKVDGQARQSMRGKIALDTLAIGTHTLNLSMVPSKILLIRESGTQTADASPSVTHEFSVMVLDPKLHLPAPTIRVMQGDVVQLDVVSAMAVDVHLHGYDVAGKVGPDLSLSIAFDANLAGRFSFETHGETHNSFVYLEVLPR